MAWVFLGSGRHQTAERGKNDAPFFLHVVTHSFFFVAIVVEWSSAVDDYEGPCTFHIDGEGGEFFFCSRMMRQTYTFKTHVSHVLVWGQPLVRGYFVFGI